MSDALTIRQALRQAREDVVGESYLPSSLTYPLEDGGTLQVGNRPTGDPDGSVLLGVFEAVRYDRHYRRTRRYAI